MNEDHLAEDLLDGAHEIGAFLGWSPRRVFYAAERKLLPIFHVGNRLSARKSTLIKRIEELERKGGA